MSINMRFAPDLVLRKYSEYKKGTKQKEECAPEKLEVNHIYDFLKQGQRAYWLEGEQPLLIKSENGEVSKPIASVIILEATHFLLDGNIYTKGKYKVIKVISDDEIYFNGCEPIKV